MKKALILFLSISLFVLQGNAQIRGVLNLSLGPAIPLGEYASTSTTDASSGLANIGATADLSYQRPWTAKSRFGWMATLRGRFNGVNRNATLAPFQTAFPGYQWSVKNGHWATAAALVGGYYQLPLSPKLSFSARIMLGVAESWSPKQTITGVRDSIGFGPTDMVVGSLGSVSATSFTGLAGLGLRYQRNIHWSLLMEIDYDWLKPTFRNVTTTLARGQHLIVPGIISLSNAASVAYYTNTRNYIQPMSCADIRVGVSRAF